MHGAQSSIEGVVVVEKKYRICIVGGGAVGGVVAGMLARKKRNITLVVKHENLARKIREEGLEVCGVNGHFTMKIPAVATPEELEGKYDYALIATKADGMADAATRILPYIDEHSRVVSMQNGICEDMLAKVVGVERTIGCVVGFGATMLAPGKVEMTSGGDLTLGNWMRKIDQPLSDLSTLLNDVIETRITDEILPELYSKLIINACVTTLGAVCGLYLGDMLSRHKTRKIFIQVIREGIDVAEAMGIRVPPGASGKLDYYRFLSPGPLSEIKRHLTIRVIGMKYRKLKSSSLQSLERGRKTEVENYNGYIARWGKELGIATPVNKKLTQMVGEIEKGTRPVSPDNFKAFSL